MIGTIATILGFGAMAINALGTGTTIRENRKRALEAAKTKPWVVAYPIDRGKYTYIKTGETVYMSDGWLRNPRTGMNLEHLPSIAWHEINKRIREEAKKKGFAGYPIYCPQTYKQKLACEMGLYKLGKVYYEIDNKYAYVLVKYDQPLMRDWKDDDRYAVICCYKNYNMIEHPKWFSKSDLYKEGSCWTEFITYKERDKIKKYDAAEVLSPEVTSEVAYLYQEIMTQKW